MSPCWTDFKRPRIVRATMTLRTLALGLLAAALPLTAQAAGERGYFAWAETQGLVGVFASPDADFDGNGITNIMSYALGLDALSDVQTYERMPVISEYGDPPEWYLAFTLPAKVPPDVSYVVEVTLEDGKRVEIARKNGTGPWYGAARILKKPAKNGGTEVSILLPVEMDVEDGEQPDLHLRVEFTPEI